MSRTDQLLQTLPDIAARELAGLTAGPALRAKIRASARPRRALPWRPVLASCAALALCVAIGLWAMPSAVAPGQPQPSGAVMDSKAAGSATDAGVSAAPTDAPSSVRLTTGSAAAESLFAPETNGNFPLVTLAGATYRMLTAPSAVPESLLGDALGTVTEYTLEPALSDGAGVISNAVLSGETVYAVSDTNGALVAAPVGGVLRAFQRVSFAGSAIVGAETLASTLAPADRVIALELTGVGAIDDAAAAQALVRTLLDNAVYQSASGSSAANSFLILRLDNGLALQMAAAEDTLVACGTWSCPEFFEAFAE